LAEQVSPEITVQDAIRAVHDDSLSELISCADLVAIATQQRHSLQPEAVVEKLKTIKLESVKFQKASYKIGNEIIIVRMTSPLSLDFELKRYPTGLLRKPSFTYRITSIHP
jgi:hypothetical protein